MSRPDYQAWHDWIAARGVIEDVEIENVWNVGRGGKYIVGRKTASNIVKALQDAGIKVVFSPPVTGLRDKD